MREILICLFLLLAFCFACRAADSPAPRPDLGKPGPKWLVESETYAIGVNDWDALAASKVAFATHVPINREYFDRLHALGIQALPYITLYQGFAYMKYEGVDLREHPEWIEVSEDGSLKRTGFWESEDAKNMYTICPNTKGYQDAMVAWVEKIMELGADGVFIDNLGTRQPCFGPKYGKHRHIHKDQNHAFAMMLRRVWQAIKRHKPDGAVLANSAHPPSLPLEYWKYIDAEMLESYICTWVSKERWMDWHKHWHEMGNLLKPHLRAGKQIQALSYVGFTPFGVKEDSYFCYATARLAGFVWSGGGLQKGNPASLLYQIRLGKPLADEQESNGVYYRLFAGGMVAVNPEKNPVKIRPDGLPADSLYDCFNSQAITLSKDRPKLEIPANSGRVYLYGSRMNADLDPPALKLTVQTQPTMGNIRFRVNGFDFWTYSGRWTTEYVTGPDFGKFFINFDRPGKHTIEIVDVVPNPMKTPAGYSGGERLGQFMDPARPTEPMGQKKYRFTGWTGATTASQPKLEIEIKGGETLFANFTEETAP
ncbi:MAG: hypothetical protein IT210_03005 [Armatimonadetes bacterium]|nr:hypothetical protein [Armatimonadota bacterium]